MSCLTCVPEQHWQPPISEVSPVPVVHKPSVPEIVLEATEHVMEVDVLVGG